MNDRSSNVDQPRRLLPDDLWSLGCDIAQLDDVENEPRWTHLFTQENAVLVLQSCLDRKIQVVLWAIEHYKRGRRGWKYAEYSLLWDGETHQGPQENITLMSLEAAIEYSLTEGIKALNSRYAGRSENDRYELQIFEDN